MRLLSSLLHRLFFLLLFLGLGKSADGTMVFSLTRFGKRKNHTRLFATLLSGTWLAYMYKMYRIWVDKHVPPFYYLTCGWIWSGEMKLFFNFAARSSERELDLARGSSWPYTRTANSAGVRNHFRGHIRTGWHYFSPTKGVLSHATSRFDSACRRYSS